MTKRLYDIDFCKGVLMTLVVWGHFCAHSSGIGYEKNDVTMYVRLFQMPLFFMISGFFQKHVPDSHALKTSFEKTFIRLGLPLISWTVASYVTIGCIQGDWGGLKSLIKCSTLYWFFVALILCKLYFSIIDYISIHCKVNPIYLHAAGVVMLLLIPRNLFNFQFNYPFYLIGVVLMHYRLPRLPISFLIAGCALTLIAGFYFPTQWTFYSVGVFIFDNTVFQATMMPLFVVLRWAFYFVATIIAFELIRLLYERYNHLAIISFFVKIGNKTLLIFGFHMLLVADVYGYFVKTNAGDKGLLPEYPFLRFYVLASVLTAITIVVSLIIDRIFQKNRQFKMLFLGER